MAINKIYEAEFTDVRNNEFRVDIYKNPQGTITAKTFVCADPGFTINWQGADNIFSPLLASTCTIPFVVEDADDVSFVTDLFTMSEGQYIVDIIADPDNTATLHWRGFLTSDNLTLPDSVAPYVIDLQAVDGLQTLSRRDQPVTGNRKIGQVLTDALSSIPTVGMYGANDQFLRYKVDYTPQGLSSYGGDFLDECKIAVTTLDPVTGEPSNTPTAETAILQVCAMLNSRIMQHEGKWTLVPMTRVLDNAATLPYSARTKTWTLPSTSGGTILWSKTLETGNNKLVGDWSIAFMPPVRRIQRQLNYLGNRPLVGVTFPGFDISASNTSQTNPVSVTTFTADIDTQFAVDTKFTLRMRVVMEQAPSATTTASPLARYKVGVLVRVGSYYLKREQTLGTDTTQIDSAFFNVGNSNQNMERPNEPGAVSWTQTNTDRVMAIGDILNSDLENGTVAGGTDTCEFEFNIQTPGLPAASDVDVEMKVFAFGFGQGGGEVNAAIADAATIFCDPQFFVGTGSDSDSITFAAVSNNNASEELTIQPASMYGESGNANDQFPAVYFGSIVGPGNSLPTGFKSSLTTSTTFINRLVCIDQLRHLQTPQEVRNGQVFTSDLLTPVNILSFDSHSWGILNMSHSAKDALYRIEVVKIAQSSGPVVDDGVGGVDFALRSILPPRTRNVGTDSLRRDLIVAQNQIQADLTAEAQARAATTLHDLGNCDTNTVSTGQFINYDGTNFVPVNDPSLSASNQSIGAGVTREIVLNGGGGQQSKLNVVDAQGNILESIQSFGSGVVIQEKYGALAVRSSALMQGAVVLYETATNGQNFLTLRAPAAVTANTTLVLPDGAGSNGQALTTDGTGTLSWSTISAGSGSFSYFILNSSFFATDGDGDYIPIGGTLSETTSSNYYTIWSAPCAGEVLKATCLVQASTAGSTIFSVRGYPSNTNLASDTQTITSGYATNTFTFSGATFSAGDRLRFHFDPTGRPSGVQVSLLIKLTHE